jgi:hypothetical protein
MLSLRFLIELEFAARNFASFLLGEANTPYFWAPANCHQRRQESANEARDFLGVANSLKRKNLY